VVVEQLNARQTQGLTLIVTALGILVLPGILVNNLQSEGVIVNNAPMICTNGTCVLNSTNPCTSSASPCNLTGSSFGVLNPCSPWTKILSLDFVGLVSSFFSSCTTGTTTNAGVTGNPVNATASGCTVLIADAGLVGPHGVVYQCTKNSFSYPYSVNPYLLWSGGSGSTLNTCLDQYDNCNAQSGNDPTTWGYYSTTSTPLTDLDLTCAKPYQSGTDPSGNNLYSFQCVMMYPVTPPVAIPGTVSGLNVTSILSFALTILGGTLLILLALGINIGIGGSILASGASTSVGSNPQGTKLAQTVGLGLLVWFPLYSEFSTWFTRGFLPVFNTTSGITTGIDGNILAGQIGIVSIILTMMMFLGLYFMSQSGTAAAQ
jgi:hypothetical protein